MKRNIFALIAFSLLLLSCGSDEPDSTRPTPWPEDPVIGGASGIDRLYSLNDKLGDDKMALVWSDEFNAEELNLNFWSYEKGYVRNKEVQYYTENRKENCRLENGMLVITGRKEPTEYQGAKYTSASIITNNKKSWKYGRFEVRAKVPAGATGIWPAFWAKGDSQNTGAGWPMCGEIDIMEYAAKDPYRMIQNVIWGDKPGVSKQNVKKVESNTKYSDDFHIYSLNWNDKQLAFAIDNKVTHVVDMASFGAFNPFHQNFSILLNLALGTESDGSLGGKFDESTLPVQFFVDYVRIYQTEQEK